MSENNKALVAAEKTVESFKKLSAEKYNNYVESGDRYYFGKAHAFDIAADLLESNMAAETMGEATELNTEPILGIIYDMVDVIGKQIIRIAYDNRDFICSRCLSTAYALFGLMEKYAREEDTADIRDKWKEITGADIEEWR